ncbi:helix-turn-helix domain-containing protein [Alicyclobacillus macrosporangiidus]|uniref:helix-turn-helix domain-containing protein n=1 Tax=Alicyclobacillus macrosporangiidus TaxID=392015 RepID=UPI0004977D13|nr:helix-turn-helix domain-containing protein [Alicyclobacillus macrosporangiidus]
MNRLLTAQEVSKILGFKEHAVYRMAREGILPVVHIGRSIRFDPEKLRAWIDGGGKALPGGWRKEA